MKDRCPVCGCTELYKTSEQSNYDYVCEECNNRFKVDKNQRDMMYYSIEIKTEKTLDGGKKK